ncbi:MAG: AAA family ATPase [Ardenticatenaceae bacterium]|nr:AAA family ATPase [Ardenticatenaceae bacterium]
MPIFQDHFLDNRHGWPLRDDWRVSQRIGDGDYTFVIDRLIPEGHSVVWKDLDIPPAEDYKVHAVIQRLGGGNHGFGLIWRGKDKDNCKAFEIAGSGYYKIKQRVNGEWSTIVDWEPCEHIRQKTGTNEILVEQLETSAKFYINSNFVHELPLTTPAENKGFGFIVNGLLKIRVHSTIVMRHVPDLDEDQPLEMSQEDLDEVLAELDEFIGMENIKLEIRTLVNYLKVQKLRREREMKTGNLSLHMVLAGPPGTGKTSVARLIGRIYKALGFLKKGHVVETDRSGLVASYVGQTAPKVDERVQEAMGGILFVDEAYALMPKASDGRDFGQEAIESLLKRMEDHRQEFALVIAGYADEMHRFLDANPGVRSRFNRYLYFEHYNPEELSLIFELFCKKGGYVLTEAAQKKLRVHMARAYALRDNRFGNGRYARNLLEKVVENHANRVVVLEPITDEMLTTIEENDLPPFTDFQLTDPADFDFPEEHLELPEVLAPPAEPVPEEGETAPPQDDSS